MPGRILVVEDHDDCREALVLLLQATGYEVDHAPTAVDGLRKVLEFHPDVAILDIDLPGMDGYELAEAMRAQVSDLPLLIATSGYGQRRDRERATLAGFDAFLLKPWDLKDLEAILTARGSRKPGNA